MSDLDKLMGKLKKTPKVEEKAEEKPMVVEKGEWEEKDFEDKGENLEEEDAEEKTVKGDPVPANVEDGTGELVEQEVAILQNDGVYRREILGVFKELVDVQKVIAQTLLDLKKRLDK